ncbi:MAG: nuclear transport factor 2 family protein [Nakamurella sp.]
MTDQPTSDQPTSDQPTSDQPTTSTIQQIAEAFSSHRFNETFAHLAPDIRWVLVGESTIDGRNAVIEACEGTAAELAGSTTEFTRFVTVAGKDAVAIDAVGRYTDPDGQISVVASCDIYQFDNDSDHAAISTITSYAVELSA